ncbi:MAG: endonuclease/exonuclease/phosphatase family protein [Kiritimatiellia bacterium]
MKNSFEIILACLWVVWSVVAFGAPDTILVATWNLENLFDTEANQPGGGDEEFTPESWRRWTPERLDTKLDNLAWVIDQMKPDILCVCEVENRAVLQQLVDRIERNHNWTFHAIAHEDSPDPRGIDNAILSRHPITSSRLLPHEDRRGALLATIDIEGAAITVLANHWKSQSGDRNTNIAIRTAEALAVRREVLAILKQNPAAAVVIAGDFNVDLDDPCLTVSFKASADRSDALGTSGAKTVFYNLLGDIPAAQRGSYYYARRKVWNTFDAILVAPAMLAPPEEPGPPWRVSAPDAGATLTYALEPMREPGDGRPKAFRRVRIKGKPENYYVEGYADHFPVITTLRRAKAMPGATEKP